MPRLLVVGAQPNSLGWRVCREAERQGWSVTPIDIQVLQGVQNVDVTSMEDLERFFYGAPMLDSVVYAAGVNFPETIHEREWRSVMARHMAVNFAAPIELLHRWLAHGPKKNSRNNFVTIASNSAYIPRSKSMTYCASKAAVVMAMRCIARELAAAGGADGSPNVYTYSPGWLEGTPMSQAVLERIPDNGIPFIPHRIPGGRAINTRNLAELIVGHLGNGRALNGCDIRIDGGEI